MRYISLFSGIEAATLAWRDLGWECLAVAEIEPFPCKVLAHHYPNVPNLGDITKITESQIKALGHVDLVVGGFPCQDLSVAGKRKGMIDNDGKPTRSGLFYQALQLTRWSNARWLVLENVPGIYSSNEGRDFASMVGAILGTEFDVPKNKWQKSGVAISDSGCVEWRTLDAQYVRSDGYPYAVPQRRRRMFAVADFGNWASRPPVLFDRESLSRNPPPSRYSGQKATGFTASSFGQYSEGVGTVRANGGDLGGGSETLAVCHPINTMTMMGRPSDDLNPRMGLGIGEDGDPSPTLTKAHSHAVAFKMRGGCEGGGKGYLGSEETAFTLSTTQDQQVAFYENHAQMQMQVRRLTPTECARLQGFPDDYLSQVPGASDSVMYKALGNSMAVNCMQVIGERIDRAVNTPMGN